MFCSSSSECATFCWSITKTQWNTSKLSGNGPVAMEIGINYEVPPTCSLFRRCFFWSGALRPRYQPADSCSAVSRVTPLSANPSCATSPTTAPNYSSICIYPLWLRANWVLLPIRCQVIVGFASLHKHVYLYISVTEVWGFFHGTVSVHCRSAETWQF